jgi:hypothetical protein
MVCYSSEQIVGKVNRPLYIMWAGQPRTGNAAYADLVEDIVGCNNIFRGKFLFLRVPNLVK